MGETAPSFVLRTRTTWERAMLTCVPRHDGVTTGQGVHSGGSRGTVSSGRDGVVWCLARLVRLVRLVSWRSYIYVTANPPTGSSS
jgi:hypothetical protein